MQHAGLLMLNLTMVTRGFDKPLELIATEHIGM